MNGSASPDASSVVADERAIDERFAVARNALHESNDRFFARFMVVQWLATILLALCVSPQTWVGVKSYTHLHVWAAILIGGAISGYPAWLGLHEAGRTRTRHVIAIGQMLMSALLIHITGGRIETHFHVFASLAFLAFYRDVRVLVTATIVVYLDHVLRGLFWSESVYGVGSATSWRSLEHASWVLFEIAALAISIRVGLKEMRQIVGRQIVLEGINRKKEEEVRERTNELATSEERFRSFFSDSPIGLYRADGAGEFTVVNPALLSMLGFSSLEEMKTSPLMRLSDPERVQFLAQLVATDQVLSREATWPKQDGTRLHVRESARAFRDADGGIAHIDAAVEDISDRRHLEERYRQAQKVQAIGQLAGGVAHDFNNILTAINGFSELLLLEPNLGPVGRRSATQIRSASDRAANLTQQLLAFSRKQRLQPRLLQLNTVVAEMDGMLQRLVGEHIRVRTISTTGLGAVRADPGQLQQVVMNLVVNARDAMPKGGQLTIETANVDLDADSARRHPDISPGPHVMLAVSDTGCGITPEVKARLFEPFFTTKAPGTGTGLGLATCHGIVKQSGGHILVYSEVGIGSTFKVFLPAARGDAEAPRAAEPAPDLQGTGTVLLVEDDASVRELGFSVLSTLGYRVLTATNGVEALVIFNRQTTVDVIVTDVVMPDMGGKELVQRVRALAPDVRVLFTSGYTFDALDHTDLQGPNVAFLSKPYGTAQLGLSVRDLLQGQGRRPAASTAAVSSSS